MDCDNSQYIGCSNNPRTHHQPTWIFNTAQFKQNHSHRTTPEFMLPNTLKYMIDGHISHDWISYFQLILVVIWCLYIYTHTRVCVYIIMYIYIYIYLSIPFYRNKIPWTKSWPLRVGCSLRSHELSPREPARALARSPLRPRVPSGAWDEDQHGWFFWRRMMQIMKYTELQ